MDRDLEQLISGLKDKKRRSLDDRSLSVDERARKSGLDRDVVEAFDSYRSSLRKRHKTYGCVLGLALAGIAALGGVSSRTSQPSLIRPVDSLIGPIASRTASTPAPVTTQSSFDIDRVLLGVRSLEDAFEQNRPVHVYTLSRYLSIDSTARQHYETLLDLREQFGSRPMDIMQIYELTMPHIRAMMWHPDIQRAGVYERVGATSILERYLRAGRESHYGIYHSSETNDLCLIELPDESHRTREALDRICSGSGTDNDLALMRRHILESIRFEGIGPLAALYKSSVVELARSCQNNPSDLEHRARILRAIIETDINHGVNSINGSFSPHLDEVKYEIVASLHNHNWWRIESPHDLEQSRQLCGLVAVYTPGQGFQLRHLLNGIALPSSRMLRIDGPHHEWYASNPLNIEPAWPVNLIERRIDVRSPRYRFSSDYEQGIAYAVCFDGTRSRYYHFEGEPTHIEADLQPGFVAPLIVLIGKDGRPMKITSE